MQSVCIGVAMYVSFLHLTGSTSHRQIENTTSEIISVKIKNSKNSLLDENVLSCNSVYTFHNAKNVR